MGVAVSYLPPPPEEERAAEVPASYTRSRSILEQGEALLSPFEKANIRWIRKSFESEAADRAIQRLQKTVGASWLNAVTSNVRKIHGRDRLPDFDPQKSYVVVANHRSFFDMYVITAYLIRSLKHRIVFPVRSNFFYDHPLGPLVNGAMSFFAMYPPIFRDRKKAALNTASLDELSELLNKPGMYAGIHPEGKRNLGDPYELLPAKPGMGRILHRTDAVVLPVFINGLSNDFVGQIKGNFAGGVPDVNVVFGAALDVSSFRARPESPEVHQEMSSFALAAVAKLAEEERQIRLASAK